MREPFVVSKVRNPATGEGAVGSRDQVPLLPTGRRPASRSPPQGSYRIRRRVTRSRRRGRSGRPRRSRLAPKTAAPARCPASSCERLHKRDAFRLVGPESAIRSRSRARILALRRSIRAGRRAPFPAPESYRVEIPRIRRRISAVFPWSSSSELDVRAESNISVIDVESRSLPGAGKAGRPARPRVGSRRDATVRRLGC